MLSTSTLAEEAEHFLLNMVGQDIWNTFTEIEKKNEIKERVKFLLRERNKINEPVEELYKKTLFR